METLQDFINTYGVVWGPIRFNEAFPELPDTFDEHNDENYY